MPKLIGLFLLTIFVGLAGSALAANRALPLATMLKGSAPGLLDNSQFLAPDQAGPA